VNKLRFEKAGDQYYNVYAETGDCLGYVQMDDYSWKAVTGNGRGRFFHYRSEAAEWLVSINNAQQGGRIGP
jgi:hypothetical protein